MSFIRAVPLALLAAALAACADRPSPTQPGSPPDLAASQDAAAPRAQRLERLARRVARALRDPAFRSAVHEAVRRSPYPEGKVSLQRWLGAGGGGGWQVLGAAAGEDAAAVAADAEAAGSLELYLPVPAHRAAWQGGPELLVATAERDGDAPAAFDLEGRRRLLDPRTPPAVPVLAVVPAETDFSVQPAAATCTAETCGGTTSTGTATDATKGLYATRVEFREDYEGWLKGQPEYEVHVMGPASGTDTTTLVSFQCVGEKAPAPYTWDQNALSWTGAQLLFSESQIAAFESRFPGQPFTVMAYEDDDAACQIRTDGDRASKLLAAVGTFVKDVKSAKGVKVTTPTGATRVLTAAKSAHRILSALYGFFTTADDVIGVAVSDSVSGRYRAGTNWSFLDQQVAAGGWIKLEMR